MIDLSALRSLLAVHQHGSVVAAAAALDFTPSAVSQQIKRLERQQGADLLERVGRGVVLTDRGRLLAERGGVLLEDLAELEHLTHDEPLAGSFHLATFSTAHRGLVAPLIARLGDRAPDLRLTVVEDDPREIVTLVARGLADAGLVHDWERVHLDLPAGIESALVQTDTADIVVHRDHRFAQESAVTPADLVSEPWVCTPPGTICHDWLLQMFAGQAHKPDLRFIDHEYATHVAMARAGVAIALVPRLGRGALPPDVAAVPVRDPEPTRLVQLIWRRSSAGNPVRQVLLAELLDLAAGQESDRGIEGLP